MVPNPTDRGKLGSKRHIVVDAIGIPLVILVPDEALRAVSGWASTGEWWSGRTAGLQALASCESALNDGWISTKRC